MYHSPDPTKFKKSPFYRSYREKYSFNRGTDCFVYGVCFSKKKEKKSLSPPSTTLCDPWGLYLKRT